MTPSPALGHSLSGLSNIASDLFNPLLLSSTSRIAQYGSTIDSLHGFFHNALPVLNIHRSFGGIRKFFDQVSINHPEFYGQYFKIVDPYVSTMFRYTDGELSDEGSMMFELFIEILYQMANFLTPILYPLFSFSQFIVHVLGGVL